MGFPLCNLVLIMSAMFLFDLQVENSPLYRPLLTWDFSHFHKTEIPLMEKQTIWTQVFSLNPFYYL